MGFSETDILQIEEKGLTTKELERQLNIFKRGNIKVNIIQAATLDNGIFSYSIEEKKDFIKLFEHRKEDFELMKFVPASGAATRMFKSLHNFVSEYNPERSGLREYLDSTDDEVLQYFFEGIDDLPFYEEALRNTKNKHPDFEEKSNGEKYLILVKSMLYEDDLNLSNNPKGLVPFHKYSSRIATAFEEHLYETSKYMAINGLTKLHFTVSKGDKEKFEKEFKAIKARIEKDTNTHFEISYSYQDPKTDTIAVDEDNEPFRDEEGNLFFRPGGHGALIENLNNIEADLVFVKNIDNVVLEQNHSDLVDYKKMLGGKLISLQEQIFEYLNQLDAGNNSESKLDEIANFIKKEFKKEIPVSFIKFTGEEKTQYLCRLLDKPLRVCGMVKNEGQPGGGPFLVKNDTGEISLQIIEAAQIDKENVEQLRILNNSTHFNPVDLVCSLKNFKGEKYDLHKYVDETMSFITSKTKDGKPLKALERPGLWNGAMADWNTVFIEVPVTTFNPVKTVVDLLKESHSNG